MKTAASLLSLLLLTFPLAARKLTIITREMGMSESKLAEVDRFMERADAEQTIAGGIVVISHQGKIGFFNTYGLRDREAN